MLQGEEGGRREGDRSRKKGKKIDRTKTIEKLTRGFFNSVVELAIIIIVMGQLFKMQPVHKVYESLQ